jgi:hypothetical protein
MIEQAESRVHTRQKEKGRKHKARSKQQEASIGVVEIVESEGEAS